MNPCYSQAPLRCRRSNLHVTVSTPRPGMCTNLHVREIKKKFKIHKIRKFEIQNDFSTDFSKVTRTNTVLHVLKRSKISSFEGGDIYQNEH